MNNNQIIEKATMTLQDLANGGQMNPEQSAQFLRMVQNAPTIMRSARFVPMNGDSRTIEKIGFGQRILRPATEATALNASDRAVPTTGKIALNAKEVIAEVNISYDTLENNIEGANLHDTIVQMIAERAAVDIEELALNGDTASADTYLKLIDGFLKKANAHTVDAASAAITKEIFKNAQKVVPAKYQRDPAAWRYYMSHSVALDWKDSVAGRQTALGDRALEGGQATAYGVPVEGVAMLNPYDNGAGITVTDGLYTHPQNLIVGMSRNIRMEFDKDIRARTFIIVLTAKVDVQIEEVDAVAKILKVKQ